MVGSEGPTVGGIFQSTYGLRRPARLPLAYISQPSNTRKIPTPPHPTTSAHTSHIPRDVYMPPTLSYQVPYQTRAYLGLRRFLIGGIAEPEQHQFNSSSLPTSPKNMTLRSQRVGEGRIRQGGLGKHVTRNLPRDVAPGVPEWE